jgi:hypothetical protein
MHMAQKKELHWLHFRIGCKSTATAQKAQQFPKPTMTHLMMAEAGRNM